MNSIGELGEKQDYKNAWEALLDQARHVQGYSEFVSLCQWREKLVDPGSATAGLKAASVINSPVNIPSWPNAGDGLERVKQITDEVCRYWINLCAKLHEHTQCEVVLNNFHPFALPSALA
jgi:hypothetical protein